MRRYMQPTGTTIRLPLKAALFLSPIFGGLASFPLPHGSAHQSLCHGVPIQKVAVSAVTDAFLTLRLSSVRHISVAGTENLSQFITLDPFSFLPSLYGLEQVLSLSL